MSNAVQKMCRLALRSDGQMWNAYYAMPGTMEGAIFLGSIAMRFVLPGSKGYHAFIDLMREAVSDLIEETIGERPVWPDGVQPAPQHEKAGNA